ncbi:heme NO-binding domain-containing protein [Neptuniibacter halophilus]|uniref:heme NO-binding domain-containing protein n=1 Tax=Neptuniibacter halophilus TaxID=651666 RepID=UPI0025728FB7|nr:heme NO-binding domain-containing protein [Neptuniibacter halophilus]
MLGIVFTEFMEMVEEQFSADVLDDVLESSNLSSDGIFTSVGYYDHQDMVRMVVALSKRVDVPVDDLIEAFGRHLFGILIGKYPALKGDYTNTLDFLESVDSTVHIQVLKLYPNAELPKFGCERLGPGHLKMHYSSKRPFSLLALGLIKGCGDYFGNALEVSFESSQSGEYHMTDFDIRQIDE